MKTQMNETKNTKNTEAERILEEAHAKINLSLDVIRRRPDGYHEVSMIMQTLELHDEVILSRGSSAGECRKLTEKEASEMQATPGVSAAARAKAVGTAPGASGEADEGICIEIEDLRGAAEGPASILPCNEDNLMYRAARLFQQETGLREGVSLRLRKRIPVAAGLAGGSSDAAAVLRGMNRLFGTGLSAEELAAIGVRIGADVPYCLMGGTVLAEGIGERLTPLPKAPSWPVLLVKPVRGISTAAVYRDLKVETRSGEAHPDTEAVRAALLTRDLTAVCAVLGNILELVTEEAVPEIRTIKEKMRACGARGVLMSGSGPTVFGLFDDTERLAQAAARFRQEKTDGAAYSDVAATQIFPS